MAKYTFTALITIDLVSKENEFHVVPKDAAGVQYLIQQACHNNPFISHYIVDVLKGNCLDAFRKTNKITGEHREFIEKVK